MLMWPTTKEDCNKDVIQSYDEIHLLLIQDRAKVIKRQPYFVKLPFSTYETELHTFQPTATSGQGKPFYILLWLLFIEQIIVNLLQTSPGGPST